MSSASYKKEWAIKNANKLRVYYANYYVENSDKKKQYAAEQRKNNKEVFAKRDRAYAQKNKESIREYKRQYYQDNKKSINDKSIVFLKNNLNARLASNLRRRLVTAIKRGSKAGSAVKDLGCTINEFKNYLEFKFQPGMTWENYGFGKNKWNIDHIMPLVSFDLSDRKQFLKSCHYTNMQPLWMLDNFKKGAKCPEDL